MWAVVVPFDLIGLAAMSPTAFSVVSGLTGLVGGIRLLLVVVAIGSGLRHVDFLLDAVFKLVLM